MSRMHLFALAAFTAGALVASARLGAATIAWHEVAASEVVDFSGQAVDGDLPATYRLPQVSPPASIRADDTRSRFKTLPLPPGDGFGTASGNCRETEIGLAGATPQRCETGAAPRAATPSPNGALDPKLSQTGPLFFPPQPGTDELTSTRSGALASGGSAPREEITPVPVAQSVAIASAAPHSVRIGALPAAPVPASSVPTHLAVQLLPAVQRGYVLAQRGALFAARTEFVHVLRRVAQAKDMAAGSEIHSQALAAGMRALDEAEDFVPEGLQYEANLDVRVTASSHRTPVLQQRGEKVLPHEAVVLYHAYAAEQLALAVADEQAGSMALYGLGRIDAQRAARKDDDLRFVRGAMTMYTAALRACPHNHLAAHELGVLECRTGRPAQAVELFQRAIDLAPTATTYHNLAVAQFKLGLHAQAGANEQESQRLAALERAGGAFSQRAGVRWVAPAEMSRVSQSAGLTPPVQSASVPSQPPNSAWRPFSLTRSLPASASNQAAEPSAATPQVARPVATPHSPRWR